MNSYILTFRTTHNAMSEEESLKSRGFSLKMIPTPRGISSECGFSIKISSDDLNFTAVLTERKNDIERIYLQFGDKRSRQYEEIYRRQDATLPSAGD